MLENVLQIEKQEKNTAFVYVESLLQMSCLHILKLKINTPLHIKKEYFTASVVKRLWISSLAAGLQWSEKGWGCWQGTLGMCCWAMENKYPSAFGSLVTL